MRRRVIPAVVAAAVLSLLPATSASAAAAPPFDFSRPEVVASGMDIPWGVGFLPDGNALVAERDKARIMKLKPGSEPSEVRKVPGVVPNGEGGLLGLAVSPTYAQDGLVYAYYTASSDNRIARMKLDDSAPEVIKTGIPRASIHNGGRLKFGQDGKLYAATGDAANSDNSQNPSSLGGKILRLNPDGSVPSDNPTAGSPVYTLGHRNVQGLAWTSEGQLWASELGQNTWDEANKIDAGKNYGWPVCEGRCDDSRFVNPVHMWKTADASPSGAAISGGTMLIGALRGQRLWLAPLDGSAPAAELQGTYGRIRSVEVAPDGWLWITTSNGDDADKVVRFPAASRRNG